MKKEAEKLLALLLDVWGSALATEEEQRECAGAGMRADDGADIVDDDVLYLEFIADHACEVFGVLLRVAMGDEDDLLFWAFSVAHSLLL